MYKIGIEIGFFIVLIIAVIGVFLVNLSDKFIIKLPILFAICCASSYFGYLMCCSLNKDKSNEFLSPVVVRKNEETMNRRLNNIVEDVAEDTIENTFDSDVSIGGVPLI